MKADGSFELDGRQLKDEAALKAALEDLGTKRPGAEVVVQPNRDIPYSRVAQVMKEDAPASVYIGEIGTDSDR
jgi:biopolymer transport protein ExbD